MLFIPKKFVLHTVCLVVVALVGLVQLLSFPRIIWENRGGVLANATQITAHRELLWKNENR